MASVECAATLRPQCARLVRSMRTADSIAQQAESAAVTNRQSTRKGETREQKIAKVKPYQWQPGQSGNPKGARRSDVARRIAKQIFENNEEEAYVALAKALLKGNAYVFKELAERAYGKLTEHHTLTDPDEILKRLVAGRSKLRSERVGA